MRIASSGRPGSVTQTFGSTSMLASTTMLCYFPIDTAKDKRPLVCSVCVCVCGRDGGTTGASGWVMTSAWRRVGHAGHSTSWLDSRWSGARRDAGYLPAVTCSTPTLLTPGPSLTDGQEGVWSYTAVLEGMQEMLCIYS